MAGIVAYGAYIPWLRLERRLIAEAWGIPGAPGEIAVGNFDEDSITMAIEAGRDCILDDPAGVGGLYFASTSPPYAEKSCATTVASVLDLPQGSVTCDFGLSLSAGVSALVAAAAAVDQGVAPSILVTAGECRLPETKTADEQTFGDGAGAVLIGNEDPIVEIKGVHTSYDEMIATWRLPGDRTVRDNSRFYTAKGYVPSLLAAFKGAAEAFGVAPGDIAKVVYPAPDFRAHGQVAKAMKLEPGQVQDALFALVGGCGCAQPLMMLAGALEEAKPGDRILLAGAGDSFTVLLLEVTDRIADLPARRAIKGHIGSKNMLPTYAKFLEYKEMLKTEEGESNSSMIQMWRDRRAVQPLYGKRCNSCETVYFPPRRLCPNCFAREDTEDVRLARKGTLFDFIDDNLYVSIEPPTTLTISDLDDGARIFMQMTDRRVGEVEIDMPVELTFRKIHDGGGFHNYFWKTRPVR
ncbi:MAG: zinc ribbon domain-containing protein [Actinomycetota bacterium]